MVIFGMLSVKKCCCAEIYYSFADIYLIVYIISITFASEK